VEFCANSPYIETDAANPCVLILSEGITVGKRSPRAGLSLTTKSTETVIIV